MQKPLSLNTRYPNSASNDTGTDFDHCSAKWQQWLDDSLDSRVRTIHVEQNKNGCRIRKRANGLLTEERLDSSSFADALKHFLDTNISFSETESAGAVSCVSHRGIENQVLWHCYHTVGGSAHTIHIFNERNIPDSLERTNLDQKSILDIRQLLVQPKGGFTIVSSRSQNVLCDMYYSLLGELNTFNHKVISLESTPRRQIARVNQIIDPDVTPVTEMDASFVFVDWHTTTNIQVLNKLLSNHHNAFIFTQAADLPSATRQLSDVTQYERQLATRLSSLLEVERVRLVCPQCCSTLQPGKVESYLLTESGISPQSVLNFAHGCSTCDYTGYGGCKTLLAHYRMNDHLRHLIEARQHDAINSALNSTQVSSIERQRNSLISGGQVEFRFTAAG